MTNFRVFLNLVVSKRGAHAGTQQPFLASNPTGCEIVKMSFWRGWCFGVPGLMGCVGMSKAGLNLVVYQ